MPVECEVAPLVRGLLKSDIRPDERVLRWFEPSAALAPFVQRIWSAQWRIPAGEHRVQPILPHPSANLVLGRGTADILGLLPALQDALARLGVGSDVNLSALAQELGYFDQAHFTRDFKRVTGVSPGRY